MHLRRLIFFPAPWSEDEARRWNPGHEEVWIRTSDGERLHGWLHFQRLGLQVLLIDYREFGRSSGRPDERGLLLDGDAAVGRVFCPVLFLHPGEDEIVPISHGRALFEKANPPKRFVVIPGGRHNDLPVDAPSIRQECLRAFLGPSP